VNNTNRVVWKWKSELQWNLEREESRFYKSETATEWEMETKRRDEDRCNSVESEKKKGTERKFDGSVWILNCFLSGCY
jgi:hypothetical protein